MKIYMITAIVGALMVISNAASVDRDLEHRIVKRESGSGDSEDESSADGSGSGEKFEPEETIECTVKDAILETSEVEEENLKTQCAHISRGSVEEMIVEVTSAKTFTMFTTKESSMFFIESFKSSVITITSHNGEKTVVTKATDTSSGSDGSGSEGGPDEIKECTLIMDKEFSSSTTEITKVEKQLKEILRSETVEVISVSKKEIVTEMSREDITTLYRFYESVTMHNEKSETCKIVEMQSEVVDELDEEGSGDESGNGEGGSGDESGNGEGGSGEGDESSGDEGSGDSGSGDESKIAEITCTMEESIFEKSKEEEEHLLKYLEETYKIDITKIEKLTIVDEKSFIIETYDTEIVTIVVEKVVSSTITSVTKKESTCTSSSIIYKVTETSSSSKSSSSKSSSSKSSSTKTTKTTSTKSSSSSSSSKKTSTSGGGGSTKTTKTKTVKKTSSSSSGKKK